jgi:hypothetical protein
MVSPGNLDCDRSNMSFENFLNFQEVANFGMEADMHFFPLFSGA